MIVKKSFIVLQKSCNTLLITFTFYFRLVRNFVRYTVSSRHTLCSWCCVQLRMFILI